MTGAPFFDQGNGLSTLFAADTFGSAVGFVFASSAACFASSSSVASRFVQRRCSRPRSPIPRPSPPSKSNGAAWAPYAPRKPIHAARSSSSGVTLRPSQSSASPSFARYDSNVAGSSTSFSFQAVSSPGQAFGASPSFASTASSG